MDETIKNITNIISMKGENMYRYDTVSMATILRDYIDVKYIDDEHENLVDIADCIYNNGWGMVNHLIPEAKKLFDKYGEQYFKDVLEDASAIDSQLDGRRNELENLMLDYNDYLNGVLEAKI